MKRYIATIYILFVSFIMMAQIPQEITQQDDTNKSLWNSTNAIIFVAVIIVLLIISRSWANRIRKKRDDVASRDEEREQEESKR